MHIGIQILYNNSETNKPRSRDGTARALRRKPPGETGRKLRGNHAVFFVEEVEAEAAGPPLPRKDARCWRTSSRDSSLSVLPSARWRIRGKRSSRRRTIPL